MLNLEEKLLEQLEIFHQASSICNNVYLTLHHKTGLSKIAFKVLYSLCAFDPHMAQVDICRLWSIPSQSVNSAVKQLKTTGLVYLEKGNWFGMDASKMARKFICLTEKGQDFCATWIAPYIKGFLETLKALPAEQRTLYLELIQSQNQTLSGKVWDLIHANRAIQPVTAPNADSVPVPDAEASASHIPDSQSLVS